LASKDINDVHLKSLSDIVGQRSVVSQLRVAIDACRHENKRLDDCLLVGPSGLGKTALAETVTDELGVTFHSVLGQDIGSTGDLADLLLFAEDNDVVFIDEAHELPKRSQTTLFRAIEKHEISILEGSPQKIPLAQFTLALATTNQHALLLPLRNRMKMILHVGFYTVEELTTIVTSRAKWLNWRTEKSVPELIAKRSQGVPRLALRLLQSCHRFCSSLHESSITVAHLEEACALEQRDDLGLDVIDRKYLNILVQGASRLNVIVSQLGEDHRNVSSVIEPTLIRLGLVCKDDKGQRHLTALGREHLSKSRPNGVQFV
jgi:holliday junction DNA helicase RuvB